VVDWDVHHGNGTQHIFDSDPQVLYISLHRYDHGKFFPSSTDGDFTMVGSGAGKGFNVNIPWNDGRMGDTEYLLAFQSIIMPIAYEFNPELVLVSAGFDAAEGDQLGRYHVSAEAYGYFTHWLSSLANGKIVLALEGGYNVKSISHSMAMCTKTLLGDPLPLLQMPPRWNGIIPGALTTIRDVLKTQSQFWKCLKFNKKLPDYDVNENKVQDDLVLGMETMNLGDSDESGVEKKEKEEVIEAGGSGAAGPSGSGEKKQTLEDYLAENLEVS
jgi:histone deacetylase 6